MEQGNLENLKIPPNAALRKQSTDEMSEGTSSSSGFKSDQNSDLGKF